jgi:hypothetical protein
MIRLKAAGTLAKKGQVASAKMHSLFTSKGETSG